MKINWFSPLLPERTDIAHYTSRVLKELRKHAEVVLWTEQETWLLELEQYATVRQYHPDSISSEELGSADINIYHIGNNAKFHGSIWKVSRKYPGIVVLHDVNLHYLFTTLFPNYLEPSSDREAYKELMKKHHGSHCEQDLEKFFKRKLQWGDIAERYPLTLAGLEKALGAIVHNQETLSFLQVKRISVLYTPLPYPSEPISSSLQNKDREKPPYRLIIFGHLGGPYRRVQVFIEALSRFPDREQFRLDIYGKIWDENYIKNLIQRCGIEDLVAIHGFVPEETLDTALANADLAINLRYPSGGEASGSQLRIWSHALPSLVTYIGWYATIPDNAVAFVRHDREIEDIHRQLEDFLKNPDRFAEMGREGQKILAEKHSPALFAKQVVNFSRQITMGKAPSVIASEPRVSVIIPTYNCASFLPKAIESVLHQNYKDYEIIVVDDGSKDDTYEALRPYRDRIRYTRFQNSQGISAARNRGIEMAQGSFVAFLDADNWFLPGKLASQVTTLEANPHLGLVNSGFRRVNKQGDFLADIEPWHQTPQLDMEAWIVQKPIFLGAIMFELKWLHWVGGFKTEFHSVEDIDLLFRLALMNCPSGWLQQVTVCQYLNQDGGSPNNLRRVKNLEVFLNQFFAKKTIPEEVKSLKNRSMYWSFVEGAFSLYLAQQYSEMIDFFKKACIYTDKPKLQLLDHWIDCFQKLSKDFGLTLNAYKLSNILEWKQFVNNFIIHK